MALSLFTGKISSVFTTLFQGISKVVGTIIETVATTVDFVSEIVTTISTPIIAKLTTLPLLGDIIESTNSFVEDAVSTISDSLHGTADQFINNNLAGGVQTLLDGATNLVGDTLNHVTDLANGATQALSPITTSLTQLPVLGPILGNVLETTDNILGFVDETADYVSSIDATHLLSNVLSNPITTVGGVVTDVSGSLDSLLDDFAPAVGIVEQLPVLGHVVEHVGSGLGYVPDALNFIGGHLQQAPSIPEVILGWG